MRSIDAKDSHGQSVSFIAGSRLLLLFGVDRTVGYFWKLRALFRSVQSVPPWLGEFGIK